MAVSSKWLRALLFVFLMLVALTGCKPDRPRQTTQPQAGAPVSPLQAPTQPMSILPTPTKDLEEIGPTIAPLPTFPPVPTPLPTPVVTPIPVASPPFIPEVVGKTPQPFWIYYWQGNEVWRVDDQGKDRQLLLDTYKKLALYLTAKPYLESGGGLRVSVSPDGQKLALVLVDKAKLTRQREPVTFSIYLFNIQTNDLKFLSEGTLPTWSPDGKHIAFIPGSTASDGFVWERGLAVADVETGKIDQLIKADSLHPDYRVSNWIWSPDSRQIAYQINQGYQSIPGIWMIDLEKKLPALMPGTEASFDRFPFGIHVGRWLPDGQHFLVIAEDPTKGLEHVSSLWVLSVQSGKLAQLTQDMTVTGGILSPDGKWIAINATRQCEQEHQPYDIWLLSADGTKLLRVTGAPPQDIGGFWSSDGTRLVFRRDGVGLVALSLQTGSVTPLSVNLSGEASYDYAVGGNK